VLQQVRRIVEHAIGTRSLELIEAIAYLSRVRSSEVLGSISERF